MSAPAPRGPGARARRIVAACRSAWPEQGERWPGALIDSDHLPPPARAAWIAPRAQSVGIYTVDLADDRPEDLRLRPVVEIASAIFRLGDFGLTAPDRRVREAAAVLRRWLLEDRGDRYDLGTALGLRGSGRSLPEAARRAEVRATLARLACMPRYASLAPRVAARKMRDDFDAWFAAVWPRLKDLRAPPPLPDPGAGWWHIAANDLARPLPNADVLAAMITEARRRGG